jgi:hypothetical protein
MKTLRALNTKLETKATDADECIHNLMVELQQVQEAMEMMTEVKASNTTTENAKLKDMLEKGESKIAQLVEKVVPLLQKNDRLTQVIEMKNLEIAKLKEIASFLSASKSQDSDRLNEVMSTVSPSELNIHKRTAPKEDLCMTNEFFFNMMSSPIEENRPKSSVTRPQ